MKVATNYKDAKTVIQMLVDIVNKNGNLLLNIPVRGDGSAGLMFFEELNDLFFGMACFHVELCAVFAAHSQLIPGLKSGGRSDQKIKNVELLGSGEQIQWKQGQDALTIEQPKKLPNNFAIVFKLALGKNRS